VSIIAIIPLYEESFKTTTKLDKFFVVSPKISNIIDWMDWILDGNLQIETNLLSNFKSTYALD
jgi:hypothetical protein